MATRPKFETIDDYLATVPPEGRAILRKLRTLIGQTVPAAKETISYQMPAFKLDYTFIYFAAYKKHIGIFPPVKGDKALNKALLPYRGEKGNLKFPLDEPMPYDLIRRVVLALHKQYGKANT
jgi:uncharacterized protein YdhG (YjbR/CyaY superfamily)